MPSDSRSPWGALAVPARQVASEAVQRANEILVWDLPVRVFHWTLVLSFVVAYVTAESDEWRDLHVASGYTALALVVFRLLWGFLGTRYARFSGFALDGAAVRRYAAGLVRKAPEHYVGHNPLGSYMVVAMLIVAVLTGVTGVLTLQEVAGEAFEEPHEVLANLWLALVVFHVAGVFVSSILHRENLVRAMITGSKPGTADQAAEQRRRGVAALIVLTLAGFWSYWLLAGALR
jgi:cytochrome b